MLKTSGTRRPRNWRELLGFTDYGAMSTARSSQRIAAASPAFPVEVPHNRGHHDPLAEPVVTLRPLMESDRTAYLEIVSRNRESFEHSIPLHNDGESDDAFFDRQLRLCAEGDASGHGYRRLGVSEDGTILGMFCLNSISRGLAWEADAIWWIDSLRAGRGVATAGVRALLDHAFADLPGGLGLHGVHCGIEPGNTASVRVAQKCGFVHKPDRKSHLKVGERWVVHEFYLASPG